MTPMSEEDDLGAAVAKGKAIAIAGMGSGNHSIFDRVRDALSPVGNETGLACVLRGHHWRLGDPRTFQFGTPGPILSWNTDTGEREAVCPDVQLPDDPTWACFCTRCGAGSYFEDLPQEVFDVDYWCYSCESRVDGDEIIEHAKRHLDVENRWPVYNWAGVHAPEDGSSGGDGADA